MAYIVNDRIKELYNLYGFNVFDENDNYIVFQHNEGYFNNIEIVVLSKGYPILDVKSEYQSAGYSVSEKAFTTLEEMHEQLFAGFFGLFQSKTKIQNNYKQFCNLQTKKKITSNEYKYIDCNYTLNNEKNDADLIEYVTDQIRKTNASLIIIEAAAGFGKTCTSYEILNAISRKFDKKIPLLAELSKNRKASIFRYVLLSEINSNFTGLRYELVEQEILNGSVVLIVDGFDELLSKSIDLQDELNTDSIKDSQTMLDTISHFLSANSKAKIILTSRKSSIFTGDIFDKWIERRQLCCDIERIQLDAPNPSKWLGPDKTECIKKNMPELFSIANPILLDIITDCELTKLSKSTTDDIIDLYFSKLLDREKERQSLILTEEEQIDIMQRLAAQFVEFDISAEEPKYIAEIIEIILNEEIEEYIDRYNEFSYLNEENLPSNEEFVYKLVHHAFLDRISYNKNNIGFINDFIFGLLIGHALINKHLEISNTSFKYLDLATTAFSVCNAEKRENLFNTLIPILSKIESNKRLYLESKTICRASTKYIESSFHSLYFTEQFIFETEGRFQNCTFYDCIFDRCKINLNVFIECQFINCKFFDVVLEGESTPNSQLIFISCVGFEEFSSLASQYVAPKEEGKNYRKILLEQFWKKGKEKADTRCGINTIYKGIDRNDIPYIDDALKELISEGIIRKLSVCYELNFSKIDEIQNILERR